MFIVKIYANLVSHNLKLVDDIPLEYRQLVIDYLATTSYYESE